MNLSMSLIASYMEKYEPECHIIEDRREIKGVRFFSDKQPAASHEYVYLGPASGYFQDPRYKDALLLANDKNQIICRGADYEELLNDVLGAFDFYNTFEQRLFKAASEHRPLCEITKMIETVISWPYLIFDINGNLIAECNSGAWIDDIFAHVRRDRFFSFNAISQIFADRSGNTHYDLSPEPQLLHPVETPGFECVSLYLTQNDERIGFVLMPADTPDKADIGMALEPMLSNVCAMAAEFTDKASVYQSDRSILLQFLRGEEVPDAVTEKFLSGSGFSKVPVLITYRSATIRNYTLRTLLKKEFETSGIHGICCDFEESTLILTPADNTGAVLDFITKRVSKGNFYTGISFPIQDPQQISTAYRQCVFAIEAESRPGIRYCKDFALPYLIQKLRETDMAANLRHPVINLLEAYDQRNNTELLKTLQVYIECGLSQAESAKKLSVHLNTLKYRLRRIFELSGIDLDDHSELLYIEISLAI